MLSVLIPVYNWDIRALVSDLLQQARALGIPFEICLLDDASEEKWRAQNRATAYWEAVRYAELPENIGRAAIRNRLGRMASYPWLLFIDCDSGVVRADYLLGYVSQRSPGEVLCGGTQYTDIAPSDPALLLRWRYGRVREQRGVAQRSKNPWASFSTHHFLVPRDIFLHHPFDERLRGYGHEDTLFGHTLQERGIPIRHLDNPLLHLGLEPAPVFLEKTRQSIRNLHYLARQGVQPPTRLGNIASRIRRSGLAAPFSSLYRLCKPPLQKNVLGKNPRLWAFDCFKLGELLLSTEKA
jgi:hypothetical protein